MDAIAILQSIAKPKEGEMKVSEAIASLQKTLQEVGDIEVVSLTEVDGRFCVEYDRIFDIVGLQLEDEAEETLAVALMENPEINMYGPPLRIV